MLSRWAWALKSYFSIRHFSSTAPRRVSSRAGAGPGRAGADSALVTLLLRSRGGIDPPVPVAFRDEEGHEAIRTIPRELFVNSAGDAVYRARLPFRPTQAELDPDFTLPDIDWSDNRTAWMPRVQPMLDNWRSAPYPIGRTLLLWRPDVWYQTEDGPEIGVAFDASTVRWEHAVNGLAGLGLREPRPFADLEARLRSIAADPRGIARVLGYQIDGHRGLGLSPSKELGNRMEHGFRWALKAGIDYDDLYDRDVARRPAEWSGMGFGNVEGTLSASRNYRRLKWTGSLRLRTDFMSERVSYGSLYAVTTADVSAIPKFPLKLRMAVGRVRGTAVPPEERFYLAGAGPRGEWANRWFRSRGTIPTRWIAALGGDGNVRGFADSRPSGSTLVALNAESRSSRLVPAWIPVLGKLRVPVVDPRSSLFADVGQVSEGGVAFSDLAADFGIGFRTKPLFRNHLILRTDLPLFRTPPEAGERQWKLRAVVSVGEAF
jgi:hypothetical protein